MTEREMFEASFRHPTNYFKLSEKEQRIDFIIITALWLISPNLGGWEDYNGFKKN